MSGTLRIDVPDPGPDGFQPLFISSRGGAIDYCGRELVMMDRFPLVDCRAVKVSRLSTRSEWRQGVRIDAAREFIVAGAAARAVQLWEDVAPAHVTFDLPDGVDKIEVRNIWDTGDGVAQSWHFGSAMIVTDIPGGRRYDCNDGQPDADFDDIVFTIERLPLTPDASTGRITQ